MFCGYLPTTHTGLLNTINSQSPFNNIQSLVFMASNDAVITNAMTDAQAAKFTNPARLTSATAGHAPPSSGDSTFSDTVCFISSPANYSSEEGSCGGGDVNSGTAELQPSGLLLLLLLSLLGAAQTAAAGA